MCGSSLLRSALEFPLESLLHRIPGAADTTHPLIGQEVFQEKPAQFMGELKNLD
jgi:hypothetical protein